jgi:hypothetical protein
VLARYDRLIAAKAEKENWKRIIRDAAVSDMSMRECSWINDDMSAEMAA